MPLIANESSTDRTAGFFKRHQSHSAALDNPGSARPIRTFSR
jgi:hypothetical protein